VSFNRTSQDVTAEFYDVEARIKNKQVQEQTLQKMLEERSGQLEEVLKVETELSRVRGEIEQMEGRIRVLKNLSTLATLTLTLREHERFQPPAPVVADFPTQVARTWQASLTQFVDAGKDLVLFAVAQVLWLPFWAVGLVIAWVAARRLAALARTRPTPPANPPSGA
jgi:chromosome segregation ATPase